MITDIRHTGIVVSDLERSLRFYVDLLGFTIKKRMDESGSYLENALALKGVKVTTAKLTAPNGGMIELLHFHTRTNEPRKPQGPSDLGTTHVALTVADLDSAYEKLSKAGVIFNCPPQNSPDGYAKLTFCKDPDGTLLELVQIL